MEQSQATPVRIDTLGAKVAIEGAIASTGCLGRKVHAVRSLLVLQMAAYECYGRLSIEGVPCEEPQGGSMYFLDVIELASALLSLQTTKGRDLLQAHRLRLKSEGGHLLLTAGGPAEANGVHASSRLLAETALAAYWRGRALSNDPDAAIAAVLSCFADRSLDEAGFTPAGARVE